MNIDPDDRQDLPRRLFALARLDRAVIASLAGDIHECGQDLLVLADGIAVMADEGAGQ